MSGYAVSTLAVRMAVLIRTTERGRTREELAGLAEITPSCVWRSACTRHRSGHGLPWRSAGRLTTSTTPRRSGLQRRYRRESPGAVALGWEAPVRIASGTSLRGVSAVGRPTIGRCRVPANLLGDLFGWIYRLRFLSDHARCAARREVCFYLECLNKLQTNGLPKFPVLDRSSGLSFTGAL